MSDEKATRKEHPYAVETRDLEKTYAYNGIRTPALQGVNLRVTSGELISIVGPSGSGKSTLLNLIGALDRPTSGTIVIDEVDISKLSDNKLAELRNAKIGFVFQSYNLIPRITALKNVEIPLLVRGLSKVERERKAHDMLEALDIGDKANRRPTQLSGGEQQRVAVARALAQDPAIILGDEPTGNLDTKNTAAMVDLFVNINRRMGKTFIIITHNMEVARRCQRIIYLKDGVIDREEVMRGGD